MLLGTTIVLSETRLCYAVTILVAIGLLCKERVKWNGCQAHQITAFCGRTKREALYSCQYGCPTALIRLWPVGR